MIASQIVTRFAPSPTGFLHIGNVRTALFNYLFAKKNNGKFLLRIEDTDRARSTQAAVEAIFEGLRLIGLPYDGEAVLQSAREARHREAVAQLLASGYAYRSHATAEEVEKIKADAQAKNIKPIYPGRNGEIFDSALPCPVRFKSPLDGSIVNNDLVQGKVEVQCKDLDDMVLLRSDGTPTYMLSVVVDDIDMNVTHVIRGDDHLINACRQIPLFQALGAQSPQYAHIPLLHGADGAKLSKRHGAVGLKEWAEAGYLTEAMINYLCGLGWTFKNQEFFSLSEAIETFDLKDIHRSPAKLDYAKLTHVSGVYLRALSAEALTERYQSYRVLLALPPLSENEMKKITQIADLFKERAATLNSFHEEINFLLVEKAPAPDEKAKSLLEDQTNRERLKAFITKLSAFSDWNTEGLSACLKEFLQEAELKMPQIGPAIRAAIAGRVSTPDIPPILAVLGKTEALLRLQAVSS